MFKKIIHIGLSLLLLVSTMGIIVSMHYCGDEMIDLSLYEAPDNCCGTDECCHHETSFFQVKEDFSSPQISSLPNLGEFEILGHEIFNSDMTLPEIAQNKIVDFTDSPPPLPIQETLSLKQAYLL